MEFTEFGKHYLLELSKCNPDLLCDVESVKLILLGAAKKSKATILEHKFHQFKPHGVSGIILIAESHFSIHTWPEAGYVAVDIFTCGQELQPNTAISILKEAFQSEEAKVKEIARGTASIEHNSISESSATAKSSSVFLYGLTLVVAACSIVYELLVAQSISILAANTVKWYSITIGVFLCTMGLGSLLCHRLSHRKSPWTALFLVECMLAIIGAMAVPLLRMGHMLSAYFISNQRFFLPELPFFITAFGVMGLIGFLTGFEIPLLIRIANRQRGDSMANKILGVDYIGALFGGVLFPILLIPYFSVMTIGFSVAILNFLMAIAIQCSRPRRQVKTFIVSIAAIFCISALAIYSFANSKTIQQYFLQKFYYYQISSDSLGTLFSMNPSLPTVRRYRSPYQRIDMVQSNEVLYAPELLDAYSSKFIEQPDYPRGLYLYLNGDFQLFSDTDEIYHEYFAHVPIVRTGSIPNKILVLGGGDGILIKELLKYQGVKSITHVDLDHVLIDLAETDPALLRMNQGSLLDPRVSNVFGDGFQFVRNSTEKFDAIYIDFPYAVDYNLSKLYSKEFYHFVKGVLANGGFVAIDAPGTGTFTEPDLAGQQFYTSQNDWVYYGETLKAAGFKSILPYVSNLETDNPRALELMQSSIGPSPVNLDSDSVSVSPQESAIRDLMVKQLLGSHTYSLQQGFIIASDNELGPREYWIPPIKLHVLNKQRYDLAFQLPFPTLEGKDESLVNSIMRPSLPNLPFWYLRTP